ncbi:MAG: peptide chain release factor 3, partial [Notoacmeibacter sp.]
GVVQLFNPEDGSPAIVGVIGALQLDVLKERLSGEYQLPVSFEQSRFNICRWIFSEVRADLLAFIEQHRGDIARDLDGDPVYLAANTFSLNYEADRAPKMVFKTLKDYQVRRAA